jgi:hypothetical protein
MLVYVMAGDGELTQCSIHKTIELTINHLNFLCP